ncbi:MAG: LLM class flavin-dependent oxidoreductase [Gemmatimonas sp.]|nr:LLM class flavin-dependent oxidoreductase [Gemmatimonas sp.]
MTFGTFHLYSKPDWMTDRDVIHRELEQAVWAEELGFATVWVAEHSARVYGILGSAHLGLAAIAARTNRIGLGTAVTRTALHHPLHLAEDLAYLDVLSDGRLIWGVGKGYDPLEFSTYGVDYELRDELWHEVIEIVIAAWREGNISYRGRHYSIPEVELFPKPLQTPTPRIYHMVSRSDSSVEFAARRLWPVVLGQGPDWDDTKRKMELYRTAARDAGYGYEDIEVAAASCAQLKQVHVAPSREQAKREYKQGLLWYFQTSANRAMFGFRREVQPYEYYLNHRNVMLGSPGDVIATLRDFRNYTGISNVLAWFNCGGQPHDQVHQSMELFSARVMPEFCSD